MGLAAALDLLVSRIESYTPTIDPGAKFRRADALRGGAHRHFMISEQVQIEPNADTRPNPVTSTITLQIFYDRRTERYAQLKTVATDAEEIRARVMYSNSDQWGLASGLGILFNSLEIKEDEKRLVISMGLKLVYNV